MKISKILLALSATVLLAACNGGGGETSSTSSAKSSTSESSSTSSSQPADVLTLTANVTEEQKWAFKDDIPVFASAWDGVNPSTWVKIDFEPAETTLSVTFDVPKATTGFLLVRCAVGTALEEGKYPNWEITEGDEPGRIYNKTDDVNVVEGTTSYTVNFVGYPA